MNVDHVVNKALYPVRKKDSKNVVLTLLKQSKEHCSQVGNSESHPFKIAKKKIKK